MAYQRRSPKSSSRNPTDPTDNDYDPSRPNSTSGIPYVEANEDLGELPLDAIDTFVVPARDDKGQSSGISLKLQPLLLRNVQICLKSNRFPYLEVSDFVRHAIVKHIAFCTRIRNSIPKSMVPAMDAYMEMCRDNDFRIRIHEAFIEIDKQVAICMQRGEHGEAVRLLNLLNSRLDGIPPSYALQEIKQRLLSKYNYLQGPDGMLRKPIEAKAAKSK